MKLKDLIKLISLAEVANRFSQSQNTIRNRVDDGTLPPPINVGVRAVRWLEHEINQLLIAHVQGMSDEEIRLLVEQQLEDRKQLNWDNQNVC